MTTMAKATKITATQVETRLYEMGSVLRRLYVRGCWPSGYRSSMPEPIHTREERFAALVEQFDIARREVGEIHAELEGPDGRLNRVGASQERVANLAYGLDRPKADPPSPGEITRMDEAMKWPGLIEHPLGKVQFGIRRTLWLKAVGMRTGKIANNLGVNRETVRLWWSLGCETIARCLNGESCIPRRKVAQKRAA